MPAERMFGIETEYFFSALDRHGERFDHGGAVRRFLELAAEMHPHLPVRESRGIFLQNASRLYVDRGGHPELCTPEVLNPWDACRYVIAGDRILAEVARELPRRDPRIACVVLSRCNVCYAGSATWGCHENYAHRAEPARLHAELVSHLVSRLIYTGGGGFNNTSRGVEFMISPRVAHLVSVTSGESTSGRGIVHTKDETLSRNGYHREHILCSESVCSQKAQWLKIGATAVVVAMIEADLRPCKAIQLQNPLAAMRRFAVDTSCRADAETVAGRRITAIEMQRHLLERAEKYVDHPLMPSWAPQVCREWREVLDRLEQGPAAVSTTLDWAIKLALYQQVAREQGVPWESLPEWNRKLAHASPAAPERVSRWFSSSALVESLLARIAQREDPDVPKPEVEPEFAEHPELKKLTELRSQFFALDTRFSQLGDPGIFAALEEAGALDHRVPAVDKIEHAVDNPPASGRARLRGQCVQRFHGRGGGYSCDWTGVWDHPNRRYLDLSDPFVAEENWKEIPRREASRSSPSRNSLSASLDSLYAEGRYEAAHEALEALVEEGRDEPDHEELLFLRCRIEIRRGSLDGMSALEGILRRRPNSLRIFTECAGVYRFRGLVPDPEIATWLRKGDEFIRNNPDREIVWVGYFLEHYGNHLMAEGRFDEARRALDEAHDRMRAGKRNARVMCRTMAALGEVHRRLGDRREAQRVLEEARTVQASQLYRGDLAEFSLPSLAKLEADPARARLILNEAKTLQTELNHRMGEARTVLLQARLDPECARTAKTRLLELKRQVPALGQCKLLAKVLRRWKTWTNGKLLPDSRGDAFWGV